MRALQNDVLILLQGFPHSDTNKLAEQANEKEVNFVINSEIPNLSKTVSTGNFGSLQAGSKILPDFITAALRGHLTR